MRLAFQGGSLVLVLRPPYRLVEAYQRFLALALGEARDAGVDLVIGSSFGFDTTRLYLTTPFAGPFSEPYLRISAGTESMLELQQLGDVLVRAMQRMARLKPADFASDAVSRAVMQWDSLRKAPLGKWHGSSAT
jgi:hypothetical protein